MSYLVDTDRVVEWLLGRPEAVELLRALQPAGLAISLITYGEVYEGIYCGLLWRHVAAPEQGGGNVVEVWAKAGGC